MHAEAVVDLVETQHREVQFRQVQGDFSMLQGKFMLQEGTPEVSMHLAFPPSSCTSPLHIIFMIITPQILAVQTHVSLGSVVCRMVCCV